MQAHLHAVRLLGFRLYLFLAAGGRVLVSGEADDVEASTAALLADFGPLIRASMHAGDADPEGELAGLRRRLDEEQADE